MMLEPVKIDLNKVPPAEMRVLCETLLEAVKRFYDDPENRRKYEEWLAKRKEQEQCSPGNSHSM